MASSEVDLIAAAPNAAEWDSIYDEDAHALPTQSRQWANAIVGSGRHVDASRLYTLADGQRTLFPLFATRYVPSALRVLSSPPEAWGFGGLIASQVLSQQEIRAVLKDCARLPAAAIQIRPNPLDDALWKKAMPSGWTALPRNAHIVDLSGGFDVVWSTRFRSDTRTRVRRAERAGVTVHTGASETLISEFYALLRQSFERWGRRQREAFGLARLRGALRDPRSKFHNMAALAGSVFRLWVARLEGRPIAAILVLKGHQAHYTRGAMDETIAGRTYANYLLHARAIEDACHSGCAHYHMGETGASETLARFKTRFGAVSVPYAAYRLEHMPILSAGQLARTTMKRLIGFRDA